METEDSHQEEGDSSLDEECDVEEKTGTGKWISTSEHENATLEYMF